MPRCYADRTWARLIIRWCFPSSTQPDRTIRRDLGGNPVDLGFSYVHQADSICGCYADRTWARLIIRWCFPSSTQPDRTIRRDLGGTGNTSRPILTGRSTVGPGRTYTTHAASAPMTKPPRVTARAAGATTSPTGTTGNTSRPILTGRSTVGPGRTYTTHAASAPMTKPR